MLNRRAAPCLAGIAALLGGAATPVWPQGEGIPGGDQGSGFYSAADLARTAAAAEPGLVAMLQEDIVPNLPRDLRPAAAALRLAFPDRGPSPLSFWAVPGQGVIVLPLESIRFFDEVATLHAWFESHGCDPGPIQSYLWLVLGQGAALPAPLATFGIDRDTALADPMTEDVSGKILSSGMLFILLHETAHQLLGHLGGLSGTLSQAQETEADVFALNHFAGLGVMPLGIVFFFQSLWWLDPFGAAVAGGTHPVSAARIQAIADALASRPGDYSFSEPDPEKGRQQALAMAQDVGTLAGVAADEEFRSFMMQTIESSYPPDGFDGACPG